MNGVWDWLGDSEHWSGADGIPHRILEHLGYSMLALLVIVLIGLPLGLYVGHTGKGGFVIAGSANALRALPSFGLLIYVVLLFFDVLPGSLTYILPTMIVLVILGIPAVLSGAYAGVQSVDPAARDAARGMGMTGRQVLFRVEIPNALPLIFSGIRSAMLQVVATAMIAAYVTLGGLGRYIIDGQAEANYAKMASGAVLVAVLAVALDLIAGGIQRLVVSPGVSGRFGSQPASLQTASAADDDALMSTGAAA